MSPGPSDSNLVTVFQLKLPNITEMPEHDDEEPEEFPETDSGNCFHIQDGGFSYKKSFKKMNSKKLSGTVDFRLKTNVTKALLKENACGEYILHVKKVCFLNNGYTAPSSLFWMDMGKILTTTKMTVPYWIHSLNSADSFNVQCTL